MQLDCIGFDFMQDVVEQVFIGVDEQDDRVQFQILGKFGQGVNFVQGVFVVVEQIVWVFWEQYKFNLISVSFCGSVYVGGVFQFVDFYLCYGGLGVFFMFVS